MHYLIDTYNLLHTADGMGGNLVGMSVRMLCQYISATAGGIKATLILDGRAKPDEPSEHEFPDITLVYSGMGVKADTVIAQRVERSGNRKKLTVVSNDREVVLHARRHFAQAMSCDAFLRKLTEHNPRAAPGALPAKKVTGTPTRGESEHWLKEFGLDMPGESARPAPRPMRKTGDPEIDSLDIEGLLGPPGEA